MQRFAIICLLFLSACNSDKENQPVKKGEEWVLTEKKRYDYKLNAFGNPDTTFITTYKLKDGNIYDSSSSFFVSKYKADRLTDKIYYKLNDKEQISQEYTVHYNFDTRGKILGSEIYKDNSLLKSERYIYNDSNMLTKSILIQSRSLFQLPDEASTSATTASSTQNIGYDTIIGVYKFDNSRKVIGTSYKDNRGNILRTDANIYSGNDPLSSHSTNFKGDTIQRIAYEKNGRILHTKLENDSFILYQNILNGVSIGQLTQYKNRNEKWRTSSSYDSKGRKAEDKLYKAM